MEMIDYISLYWFIIKLMIYFTVMVLFISGLDDFFIDIYYWVREAYRKLVVRRKYPALPIEKLLEKKEVPLA